MPKKKDEILAHQNKIHQKKHKKKYFEVFWYIIQIYLFIFILNEKGS